MSGTPSTGGQAHPAAAAAFSPFSSILFPGPAGSTPETRDPPEYFRDLNLDQVVAAITAGRPEYDLAPFFFAPLTSVDAIACRQEVMQDLEGAPLMRCIREFAGQMARMRRYLGLATSLDVRHEKARWFLSAAESYAAAVRQFARDLGTLTLTSRGMRALRDYLTGYTQSATFETLAAEAASVAAGLDAIRYSLLIDDNRVTVFPYSGEDDYTAAVEAAFERFRRGQVRDYRQPHRDTGRLSHVEAQILERVARLNPAPFAALDEFCARHREYPDAVIIRFDREVQFFVAYLAFINELRHAGLPFCYPRVSAASKEVHARDSFDLALAARSPTHGRAIVLNSFELAGTERVFVISGPNQGGKTTFARTFGQLHYLGRLGCPVPGTAAHLFLYDRLFTHFEREERVASLRGKLQDELCRIRTILEQATPRSLLIMNELFASTTVQDALGLGRRVMDEVLQRDALAVFVTFLDELATSGDAVVSMVSTVDPLDPALRTFKIERRPADGLAYAMAIAEKYRVTFNALQERVRE